MTTKNIRARKPKLPAGYILYQGPSMLDGAPIVVIVTALRKSRNSKTGNMAQTYIIRADEHPIIASRTGGDYSICGTCKHRGDGTGKKRSCYVTLAHGPSNVYRSFLRGVYVPLDATGIMRLKGKTIRFGTYGDPAAAPHYVWDFLSMLAGAWTGYTHQWRDLNAPTTGHIWSRLLMASVDTPEEMAEAHAMGWRTFRVGTMPVPDAPKSEVICPASEEMGKKTTCEMCRACMGSSAKAKVSIRIAPHGTGKKWAKAA